MSRTKKTEAEQKVENVEQTKIVVYVNDMTSKDGKKYKSYRTKNEELDKYVNVIFCKEAKTKMPLQTCLMTVNKKDFNFGKDFNGYDVMFLSNYVSVEPYIK